MSNESCVGGNQISVHLNSWTAFIEGVTGIITDQCGKTFLFFFEHLLVLSFKYILAEKIGI